MMRNTGIWIRIYPEFIQILPAPTSYFLTFVNKYCQNIATTNQITSLMGYLTHDQSGCVLWTKYKALHKFLEDTCLRLTIAGGRHARAMWHRILPAGSESKHTGEG